jgi:hypothetical protein
MKTVCVFMVAFCYQVNLFPLFSSLKVKTNAFCQKTTTTAMIIVWLIYTSLSIICSFLFGKQIMQVGSNVILNINNEYVVDDRRWEAFVLRVLFMIVLACHVPFVFFSAKEAMLIIVDELDRRSISKELDIRVLALQKNEAVEARMKESVVRST